ncbi:alpha-(1,3)-fucosyltransferase B isoform X2 [Drosophila willistoni]|uniref:alpha-(1,3)-fucosyltransferase B isoform X2 n=1 Tax=Drosophila willistoni TaxID=7260 RepID=UPI000C26C2EA|nr:alpha-(1,3)-fucosyltransferase B isoform X2 [Drosophila willistoni]
MRPWRNRHLSIALHLIIWLTILVICWNIFRAGDKPRKDKAKDKPTEVLWWSSAMSWSYDEIRTCGIHKCRFTNNRQRLSQAMAVLFYGSNMKMHDFPLPRLPQHIWALLHEESPRNVPFVPFNEFLRHFNYTSTFSRHSDLPLTTQYLPGVSELTTMKYFNDFYTKSFHFTHVIFLQSDCDTMSGREDYVKELIRHIRVDSYGKCLHNKDLPPRIGNHKTNRQFMLTIFPMPLPWPSIFYFWPTIKRNTIPIVNTN